MPHRRKHNHLRHAYIASVDPRNPPTTHSDKNAGALINLHPFWVCPRNLFLHNIYVATQIKLADINVLYTNSLGTVGLMLASMQWGSGGLMTYFGVQLSAWAAWIASPQLRPFLSSPELKDAIQY